MADLSFGYVPSPLTVHLTAGADFVQTLTTAGGSDFPDGAVVGLVFSDGTTWAATVSGASITWDVDKADVETLHTASCGLTNPRGEVEN